METRVRASVAPATADAGAAAVAGFVPRRPKLVSAIPDVGDAGLLVAAFNCGGATSGVGKMTGWN